MARHEIARMPLAVLPNQLTIADRRIAEALAAIDRSPDSPTLKRRLHTAQSDRRAIADRIARGS